MDKEEDSVRSSRSSPSSLFTLAPLLLTHQSANRSKFRCWKEEPNAGSSDDKATCPSYLDIAREAL
jgi:hypothetical protein